MKRQIIGSLGNDSPTKRCIDRQGTFILIHAFLVFTLGYLPFHAFAAFLLPAGYEFGTERGDLAAVISLYWVVRALTAPLVGFATRSVGAIKVQFVGIAGLAITFLLASQASSLFGLYLTYGVGFGLFGGAITDVPTFALLRSYFSRRLGAALGIAAVGMSMGLILMPFITGAVVQYGWRISILGLAVIPPTLLGLSLAAGLRLAGIPIGETRTSSDIAKFQNIAVKQTLQLPAFWLLFGAVVLGPFAFHTPLVHQIAYLGDYGYSSVQAGRVVALMGFAAVFGRLLAGTLSDNFGRPRTYYFSALLTAVALFCLLLGPDASRSVIVYYALAFGLGHGAFAPLFPAASADLFAGHNYPAIHALLFVGVGLGGAVGAWLPGKIFDSVSSYRPALILATVAILVSAWLFDAAQRSSVTRAKVVSGA